MVESVTLLRVPRYRRDTPSQISDLLSTLSHSVFVFKYLSLILLLLPVIALRLFSGFLETYVAVKSQEFLCLD